MKKGYDGFVHFGISWSSFYFSVYYDTPTQARLLLLL
jgi:hypothetical protein